MGSQTHLSPKTEFAHRLNAYFRALVEDRGWDASGRHMEDAVGLEGPRRSLWAKFYADSQAMNANEIEIAASVFKKTPHEFVTESRYFEGKLPVIVGGSGEHGSTLTREEEEALRKSDVDLAALRGVNEAERPRGD